MRIDWRTVISRAEILVRRETNEYGSPPTLRRAHYMLVSDAEAAAAGYSNTQSDYSQLSRRTAKMRDAGTFPEFTDRKRGIERASGYSSLGELIHTCTYLWRVDRSELMPKKVVIIAEKDGIIPILSSSFDWLDLSALSGYSSQTHGVALAELLDPDRPTVAIYIGDYDPSGLDISRNLAERLPYPLRRIGLSRDQVLEHNLTPMAPKKGDSRNARMVANEGAAMQVELDALPAEVLLAMVAEAITDETGVALRSDGTPDWPDVDRSEKEDRDRLVELANEFSGAR